MREVHGFVTHVGQQNGLDLDPQPWADTPLTMYAGCDGKKRGTNGQKQVQIFTLRRAIQRVCPTCHGPDIYFFHLAMRRSLLAGEGNRKKLLEKITSAGI